MALAERITRGAGRRARYRQSLAELRLDELVKIAGIPDEYTVRDRHGNLAVERAFALVYQLVDSDEERAAVVRTFAEWQRDERRELSIVRDLSNETRDAIQQNNPTFIDGQFVPGGLDGAA